MANKVDENDKKEIETGVKWLCDWMRERYNNGHLSKEQYQDIEKKLSNAQVFITDRGYDKVIDALEKGELHFTDEALNLIKNKYGYKYSGETVEEKAIAYVKDLYSTNDPKKNILAYSCKFIKEPAIFLDIDKIKNNSEKDTCPRISSLVVHEFTHCLNLKSEEKDVNKILNGEKINTNTTPKNEKIDSTPHISVKIFEDIYEDKGDLSNKPTSEKKRQNFFHNNGLELKDGVFFDSYLDTSKEVYARLMQLRYDFGLKADENFSLEQIMEIEKRAKEAKEKFNNNDEKEKSKADIDFNIVERYKSSAIEDMLNNVADGKISTKNAFKVQRKTFERQVNQLVASTPEKDEKTKTSQPLKYPSMMLFERRFNQRT
ncbi:MAG: hypothetical protein IKW58_00825 [Alphaproteobacteria bacterium]|nr:hypothetical protein [Alphaproteobacteria bacterium]